MASLLDTHQRPLHDLRISLTDRCNLRCTYCMPRAAFGRKHVFLPRAEILNFAEIETVVRSTIPLGIRKLRLSGGEPLLRHEIERLIARLADLRTVNGEPLEIALTTNGVLLPGRTRALRDAGLTRLTVSLDALNPQDYQAMTDSKISIGKVLDGIFEAQQNGLTPVKVNAVIRRAANEHEILPLVRHFRHSGIILRFIEFMDVGNRNAWRAEEVFSAHDILACIKAQYPLHALSPNHPGEVAERWAFADGAGEIGIVASVSQPFCGACSRLRLSTDGKLYTCLFATTGFDLRALLRAPEGFDEDSLRAQISALWQQRSNRYSMLRHTQKGAPHHKIEMSYIGG